MLLISIPFRNCSGTFIMDKESYIGEVTQLSGWADFYMYLLELLGAFSVTSLEDQVLRPYSVMNLCTLTS